LRALGGAGRLAVAVDLALPPVDLNSVAARDAAHSQFPVAVLDADSLRARLHPGQVPCADSGHAPPGVDPHSGVAARRAAGSEHPRAVNNAFDAAVAPLYSDQVLGANAGQAHPPVDSLAYSARCAARSDLPLAVHHANFDRSGTGFGSGEHGVVAASGEALPNVDSLAGSACGAAHSQLPFAVRNANFNVSSANFCSEKLFLAVSSFAGPAFHLGTHAASGTAGPEDPVAVLLARLLVAVHLPHQRLPAVARKALPGVDPGAAAASRAASSDHPLAVDGAAGKLARHRSGHVAGAHAGEALPGVDPDAETARHAAAAFHPPAVLDAGRHLARRGSNQVFHAVSLDANPGVDPDAAAAIDATGSNLPVAHHRANFHLAVH